MDISPGKGGRRGERNNKTKLRGKMVKATAPLTIEWRVKDPEIGAASLRRAHTSKR